MFPEKKHHMMRYIGKTNPRITQLIALTGKHTICINWERSGPQIIVDHEDFRQRHKYLASFNIIPSIFSPSWPKPCFYNFLLDLSAGILDWIYEGVGIWYLYAKRLPRQALQNWVLSRCTDKKHYNALIIVSIARYNF